LFRRAGEASEYDLARSVVDEMACVAARVAAARLSAR